jgi:hypothetical protein
MRRHGGPRFASTRSSGVFLRSEEAKKERDASYPLHALAKSMQRAVAISIALHAQ